MAIRTRSSDTTNSQNVASATPNKVLNLIGVSTPQLVGTPSRARISTKDNLKTPTRLSDDTEKCRNMAAAMNKYFNHYLEQLQVVQRKSHASLCHHWKTLHHAKFDSHEKVLSTYSFVTHKKNPHAILMKSYGVWEKLRPVVISCKDSDLSSKFVGSIKRMAALMFLNGHYYKGLLCLRDCMIVGCKDLDIENAFEKWCVLLNEWEIYEEFKKSGLRTNNKFVEHDEHRKLCTFALEYGSSVAKKEGPLIGMYNMIDEIGDQKSYIAYENLALLHYTLSSAYRSPSINPNKSQVKDGLYHLERMHHYSEVIVKNRLKNLISEKYEAFQEFLPVDALRDTPTLLTNCLMIAQHFFYMQQFCFEMFKSGQLREALGHSLQIWLSAIRLGVHNWVVKTTFLCWWPRYATEYDKRNEIILKRMMRICYEPEIDFDLSISDDNLDGFEDEGDANKTIGVIDQLAALCLLEDDGIAAELHSYSEHCSCQNCSIAKFDGVFNFEWTLSSFIYADLPSTHGYEDVEEQFTKMRALVAKDQIYLLGKEVKPRPPFTMSVLWCTVIVHWMRMNDGILRELPSQTIIARAVSFTHKVTAYAYNVLYSEALCLKQAARGGVTIPQFEWMNPNKEFAGIMDAMKDKMSTIIKAITPVKAAIKKEKLKSSDDEKNFELARRDYKLFSHLMYREWRLPICSMIAQRTSCLWEKAMMMAEMGLLATRQAARSLEGKVSGFDFSDRAVFKHLVQKLPEDMSVIQIISDDCGTLHLIKLHADREPIVVPLANKKKVDALKEKLRCIIEENDRTGDMINVTDMNSEIFWTARRKVDEKLKNLLKSFGDDFLGPFEWLLRPSEKLNKASNNASKVLQELSMDDSKKCLPAHICKELVQLFHIMPYDLWKILIARFCDICNVNMSVNERLVRSNIKLYNALKKATDPVDKSVSIKYSLLVLPPDLSSIPWEALSVFESHPYVGRMPSVHQLFRFLMKEDQQLPRRFDGSNAFYVMDPENNLKDTSKRMGAYFPKFGWTGTHGKVPDSELFKEVLQDKDLYIYIGHGSGARYFSRNVVRQSGCKAVGFLMGCSSLAIVPEGRGMDGRSCLYDYTIAQCPCVIGCLWMVTDGEIDRYTQALSDYMFDAGKKNLNPSKQQRLRLLMDGMAHARKAVKLRTLTGAAVVSYGIPVESNPFALSSK